MKHVMEIRVGQDEYGMYRAMEKETQAGGKGWTVRNAISDLFEELDGRAFWAGQTIQKEGQAE